MKKIIHFFLGHVWKCAGWINLGAPNRWNPSEFGYVCECGSRKVEKVN